MALADARREDVATIATRLEKVRERVSRACQRAGRKESEITLIGVTKTHTLETIAAALEVGLQDLGENKPQELASKAQALAGAPCRWHMIGHLQRNKARIAVEHAHLFHALDSVRLADALQRRAETAGRVLDCLVQVNVSQEVTKFGVAADAVHDFLQSITHPNLRVTGLMTLAAPVPDPEIVRPQFRTMRRLLETAPVPGLTILSMGMSGDYEVAIEEGATHIRVGSAIFGPRRT